MSSFQNAQTVQDELLAICDPKLEYTDCQDLFNRQNPYDKAIKFLATTGDNELQHYNSMDTMPKEESDFIIATQSCVNDRSHYPHIGATLAAMALYESVVAISS